MVTLHQRQYAWRWVIVILAPGFDVLADVASTYFRRKYCVKIRFVWRLVTKRICSILSSTSGVMFWRPCNVSCLTSHQHPFTNYLTYNLKHYKLFVHCTQIYILWSFLLISLSPPFPLHRTRRTNSVRYKSFMVMKMEETKTSYLWIFFNVIRP